MAELARDQSRTSTEATPPRRSRWRRIRHRLRPLLSKPLFWLGLHTLPRLYRAYMQLVWATSRVERNGLMRGHEIAAKYDGFVALTFHEEVLFLAYVYPRAGYRVHGLASVADAGAIISRTLELCGFEVFRGGSTSRASRRRLGVLRSMIEHMKQGDRVLYGLTVDGSKGPAYQMKEGGIAIARGAGRPIVLVRSWSSPCLRLPTWDRTALPLPFSKIWIELLGPFFPPGADAGEQQAERFRLELERDLIELVGRSHDELGQARPRPLDAAAASNAAALEAL